MNILIIGKNSYIGVNLKEYLSEQGHRVSELDVEHVAVREEDFVNQDCVIHVAAIVHRKDVKDYGLYKKVNVDLPVSVASMAKRAGVKQFVFFSSMAVYRGEKSLRGCVIDDKTPIAPKTDYGRSKWEAEQQLLALEEDRFKVPIIRPANVYGKNCPGGYIKGFKKITEKLPFIPVAFENVGQGMIYIKNLCELVRLVVENGVGGIFPAQDQEPVSAVRMMECICEALGLKKKKTKLGGLIFKILQISPTRKLYGGISYAQEYAKTELGDYCCFSFEQGMEEALK